MSIYAERLLRLRDLLLALPPTTYTHQAYKCGTGCCALGWAVSSPEQFPELPLQFVPTTNGTGFHRLLPTDGVSADEKSVADKYFGYGAYDAIFDQFAYEPEYEDEEVTVEVVAARIVEFVTAQEEA